MSAQREETNVPGKQETYVLTEEEKRTLSECEVEAFRYRSLPMSVFAMVATQSLIYKGVLSAHTRFGSVPKLIFAGFVGYMAGKLSYIQTCKQKLMKLENSPLAEILRQGKVPNLESLTNQPKNVEFESEEKVTTPSLPYSNRPFPKPEPPSTEYSSEYKSGVVDVPFSASMSESSTTGISDNIAHEPEYEVEVPPKSPPVTYEELRNRNRGVYEVLKPQAPAKPAQSRTPKIEVKKNKYGDVWED